jgi:DNA helicase-2/ATP-dependent DNA helicase PcrA
MINFHQELNPEQLNVVLNGDGACLVLAGAGSGKTRVITYRVAYLLEQGIKPEEILLVTFTNKAAAEMKQRVSLLTGNAKSLAWSGTFHHIAYRILSIYSPLLGFKKITILDSDDSETLLKLCVKEAKSDDKRFPSAKVIGSLISYARNAEMTLDEVIDLKNPVWIQFTDTIKAIADRYRQKKIEAQAMDFDDLLVNLLVLLNNPQVQQKYAEQFKYVLVDEYQDTNKIQASILKKFSSVHNNLLVVGDDAQSIYSFRAADIRNILSFDKNYSDSKIYKLQTNYRSTKEILDLANNVIANNRDQFHKELKTFNKTGSKPFLYPLVDQSYEARFVVDKIKEAFDEGISPHEIAILFRAAHHSQMLELELTKSGIAYEYRGGVRFFERAHIKDVLSYLRLLNNLADTAAWLRVLMHEEGIGAVGAQKIAEMMKTIDDVKSVKELGLQRLGGKAQVGWQEFCKLWDELLTVENPTPGSCIKKILESHYRDYLESEYIDSNERVDDLKQLAVFAERYTSLDEFLAEATLQESFSLRGATATPPNLPLERGGSSVSPPAGGGVRGGGSTKDKIILSTIHQAKGLEWSIVFIINLTNGNFPNERALRESQGLEEERRLFYVAITRAKDTLYLTYPMAGGHFGDFLATPSQFLSEIDLNLCEDHSLLSTDMTIFNDGDVQYVAEEDEYSFKKPLKIKPGSFLRSLDDL